MRRRLPTTERGRGEKLSCRLLAARARARLNFFRACYTGAVPVGRPLSIATLEPDALGAHLLAHERQATEPAVTLGPREQALLDAMPWPHRRNEWLHGRRVAQELLERAFALPP